MVDRLELMFEAQSAFNRHFRDIPNLTPEQRTAAVENYLLDLYSEVSELRQATDTHAWRKHLGRKESVVEEAADVFAYLASVLLCYNISAEQFSEAYFRKMQLNEQDYQRRHSQ